MRKLTGIVATFVLVALAASTAQALPWPPTSTAAGGVPAKVTASDSRGSASLDRQPATPRAGIPAAPCEDLPDFLCGSVRVPVDRADPDGRKLRVAFRILPHGDPGPGLPDPVFVADGGPGGSTTASAEFFAFLLGGLADERDIVFIDQRGTGLSGVIRCRDLQDGVESIETWARAIRRCSDQLGDDNDRYGSGDIAKDIEAVRRALGYDQINYFGVSYGSVILQAYAARYPERVRAAVADAGLPVNDPEHAASWILDGPLGRARAIALACDRAPSCTAAHPDPEALLAALLDRLAAEPLTGIGYDLFGERRRITVDQFGVEVMAGDNRVAAEITAAADALLNHDDAAPLLRLGAESLFWPGPEPARFFSAGANFATFCNDADFVFDRTDTRAVKRQDYVDALAALPDATFAPWTVEGWEGDGYLGLCTEWGAPDRFVPAIPNGTTPIDVPALLIAGDVDTTVATETVQRLAGLFADPDLVEVQGAGHIPTAWNQCARDLTERFIDDLGVGDTSCADTPEVTLQAQSRFPVTSDLAPEATPRPALGDESTAKDRRAAWSTAQTVLDVLLRSIRQPAPVAPGAGLRGGTFLADYIRFDDRGLNLLRNVRFVRDVAVEGRTTISYDFDHPRLRSHVTIHGAGTADGELRLVSRYWFDTFFGPMRISGEIGGRHIEVRVPTN